MPMPFLRHGLKDPLVTTPTCSSPSKIGVPSRAGAPLMTNPARLRVADLFAHSERMRSEPTKLPGSFRRRLAITQSRVPSTGEVVSSRSLPYKQRPASSRSESRAPSPTGSTSSWSSSDSQRVTTPCFSPAPLGTAISKPSSPVYPLRLTKHSSPMTVIGFALMKDICVRSSLTRRCSTSAAFGPWSARIPLSASVSIETSPPALTNSAMYLLMWGRSFSSWPALITMYRWSPAFVTIMSSMTPPSSFVSMESEPIPSGRALMSAQHSFSMNSTRSLPLITTPSMCETSKRPALFLVCMCDSMMPAGYCTGMSQPPNSTILPPSATWFACSGVLRSGPSAAAAK
mmetsp:Transcript_6685/g.14950  ORF Transcript_6685/g.14950 Transcript_6685/m.14950 type:complete len:344 (-) Transcript_6685:79-1110(-)